MGEGSFSISTAIAYANGRLHIGHCYEIVIADTLARYQRARGEQVHFLTGTDEFGLKNERAASAHGISPQTYVDGVVAAAQALYASLGVSHDDFIRTTEARHTLPVQAIFTRLYEQGDIYLDRYEGWYCQHDEAFWAAAKIGPEQLCPECGRPLEWAREEAYRFRLAKYAPQVEAFLRRPGALLPESRQRELLAFVAGGLEDIAVSRTGVKWGIPVPFDPAHTIYVWIDALCNYITALGYGSKDDSLLHDFWPADVQIIGKDITRFHATIWPALLTALGLPLPRCIFAHGFLNTNGEKISKSRGNAGATPEELIACYGVDALRNYLLREVPYAADGEWSEDTLRLRTNVDLANDLGNLLSRTTQLIVKFSAGIIPAPGVSDGVLQAAAASAVAGVERHLPNLHFADAIGSIWTLIDRCNKYIEEQQPWALAKTPAAADRLSSVLYDLAEALRVCAGALVPFLITAPEGIYDQLGLTATAVRAARWAVATAWGGLPPGTSVRRGQPLFPRLVD